MVEKAVLVFAPRRDTFENLCQTVERTVALTVERDDSGCRWVGASMTLNLDVAYDATEARKRVRGRYYSAIIVDCRHMTDDNDDAIAQEKALIEFLEALRRERDRERRYPFRRIAVLVGDADEERVDRLLFHMGERHIGSCIRDLSLSPRVVGEGADAARARLAEQIWDFCERGLAGRKRGKKAINAAGGGITGLYYELGVLKCLHDAFANIDIRDFDMYFGISAGALAAAFVANGIHIDTLIANIGEINPNTPYKFRIGLRHLLLGEMPRRLGRAQKNLWANIADIARGREKFSVATLVGSYAAMLGPIFDNAELEEMLRAVFSAPGRTNEFRMLDKKLYIGATDQDRRQHVLFGDRGFEDVPISKAIQASAAVNPFFPSVRIQGRYYTDGAVTRTSNIKAAIRKGANLIFVIDPFLPLISDTPGYNRKQDNIWLMQQDFKTIAYTRFEQVSEEILRLNPQVNCYTFLPSNRMRELMTQNPLVATNFHPIVTEAYRSTYRRLIQLEYKVSRELAAHGIELDLRPVADRVHRLRRRKKPDARVLLE